MWPFKPRRPPIEQKSLAAPSEELLAVFGLSLGGASVSPEVALSVPAVAAAVRVISEAAATLEVRVERRDGDAWTLDEEHPASTLLRNDACEWASASSLSGTWSPRR